MADQTAQAFNRLLVPLDGSPRSEEALPYALAVAAPGAAITLLYVVGDAHALRRPLGQLLQTADEVLAELSADATREMDAAIARSGAADADVTVEAVVRVGNVAGTILGVADELGVDAIVIASSGRGLITRLALGSVADRVARESTRPTLVVRELEADASSPRPSVRRVVAPVDGSARGQAALPIASMLARQLGVPIALISVVEPTMSMGAASLGGGMGFSGGTYTGLDEQIETVAREQLAEAERGLAAGGAQVTTELAHGPAASAIIAFARPSDLIVMTSRGNGGFLRLVLGSVAEILVREAPAPVLLVPVAE